MDGQTKAKDNQDQSKMYFLPCALVSCLDDNNISRLESNVAALFAIFNDLKESVNPEVRTAFSDFREAAQAVPSKINFPSKIQTLVDYLERKEAKRALYFLDCAFESIISGPRLTNSRPNTSHSYYSRSGHSAEFYQEVYRMKERRATKSAQVVETFK